MLCRTLRLLVPLMAAGAALAGCTSPLATAALEAQRDLIGLPRAELLSCAGAPAAAAAIGPGEEVLTYVSSQAVAYGGGPMVGFGYGSGLGAGFAVPLAPRYDVAGSSCRASFTVRNGIVTRIVYGGDDREGASRLEQCYRIVENCALPAQPKS